MEQDHEQVHRPVQTCLILARVGHVLGVCRGMFRKLSGDGLLRDSGEAGCQLAPDPGSPRFARISDQLRRFFSEVGQAVPQIRASSMQNSGGARGVHARDSPKTAISWHDGGI